MFIDEMKIRARAGRGGDGVVRWRHERGREFAGPSGGDGGRGGNVYARAVRDLGILSRYRHKKEFFAGDGGDGMKDSREGKNGEDVFIDVPVGSVITDMRTGEKHELLKEGETVLLLKGGAGGYGNEHFKGSRNVRPKECTPGKEGEKGEFFIEVELIADAGLVGLPNAGKTSLLNALTAADRKVGNYPFTTLEPALGTLYGYVIADIPGLIEGAAKGKGLGHKFLRHIKRTRALIHCVSLENESPANAYESVRRELAAYHSALAEKPELVLLTKKDTVSERDMRRAKEELQSAGVEEALPVSVVGDENIKEVRERIVKFLQKCEEGGKV